jgi:GT2 family glycosyltransferase
LGKTLFSKLLKMNRSLNKNADKAKPLVWIILVNWNGRDDTLACLASLRKITFRNYNIILVDNASTDGSVNDIRHDFPEVEIIENSKNRRFAAANNQGIERALAAGADLVLLLNNDTEVAPDFLDEMVHALRSHPEIGMAGPKIFYYDDRQRIWFAGGEIDFWKGRTAHRGLRRMDGDEWNVPGETDYITGCCLLVTRNCIEKTGVLDEGYFIYSEDADWCVRARRVGYKCWYVPSAHVWHKISASSGGGLTAFKAYHKVRSNFLFFKRYARWWHWLTIPWCVATGALIETVRLLLDRQSRAGVIAALWRAFVDIFRRKPTSP